MSTVLFTSDLPYSVSPASADWVEQMCRTLLRAGHDVTFLPREHDAGDFHDRLGALGVEVLEAPTDPEQLDETGIIPRFQARRLIPVVQRRRPDWVLAQGVELSRFLAGNGSLSGFLWALLSDAPFRSDPIPTEMKRWLPSLAAGCHRIVVVTEAQRAWLESEHVELTSKIDVTLPVSPDATELQVEEPRAPQLHDSALPRQLVADLDYFRTSTMPDLVRYRDAAQARRTVPELRVLGGAGSELAEDRLWKTIPGVIRGDRREMRGALGLLPSDRDPIAVEWAIDGYRRRGITPVAVAPEHPDPRVVAVDDARDLLDLVHAATVSTTEASQEPAIRRRLRASGWFPPATPPEPLWPGQERPLRLVVAGADFKFAGDLITALAEQPWIDLRVDLFEHNAKPQPETSAPYLDWAEVVIAEFASRNALWYADHLRADQRLIVHLHGYELLSDWINDLAVDNVHSIVVASEMYRDRALAMKEWPSEKMRVIGNSVSATDLLREKVPDARFHVGLAGYVPILKRPDRALDLLRLLRQEDPRYTLHMRGHSPWNYAWEWKKTAHQDAYREQFLRIGQDPLLREGISFEPFGPDMGNWLRRIGWMLSTSTRETFHLAGIEGAASGAVPLVWEREGSREIFSDRWNFASTEDVARFVLEHNADESAWEEESARAIDYSTKYEASTITSGWLALLGEAHGSITIDPGAPSHSVEEDLRARVEHTLADEGYEAALTLLDANIPVTAHDRGALKDIEMWVRGISILDIDRFSLFPAGRDLPWTSPSNPLTLRLQGGGDDRAAGAGLERRTLEITPPGFADGGACTSDDMQPDRPDSRLELTGKVRADRWISTLASRIAAHALDEGIDLIFAEGPWWFGLTGALAASRAQVRFAWKPAGSEDWDRAQRALNNPFGGDVADHLALRAFQGSTAILIDGSEPAASLTEHLPILRPEQVLRGDAPVVAGAPLEARYQGLRSSLVRPARSIRAVIVGQDDLADAFAAAGVDVVRARLSRDVDELLSAHVDLFVLDGALTEEKAWGRASRAQGSTVSTRAAKHFDAARAIGARAVLLLRRDVLLDADLLSTARRADVIAAPGTGADQLMELNPISVQQIVPGPRPDDPASVLPFLRRLGLPVNLEHPVAPATDDAADEGLETDRQVLDLQRDGELHALVGEGSVPSDEVPALSMDALDGITVIIPTHKGRERIGRALDSILRQTIPTSLLEVIVVENGDRDGTEELVRDVDARTDAHVVYLHEPRAGASRARNLGLRTASQPYVTFLDDDDEFERNHLLALWSSAGPDSVVVSWLTDVDEDGTVLTDTHARRRYLGLSDRRAPLDLHPEFFGFNAGKLIPTETARRSSYPTDLASGEDVVYMAGLLAMGLSVIAAAPLDEAGYLRHRRHGSVSRNDRGFDFYITDRLLVLRALEDLRAELRTPEQSSALDRLQIGQRNFVKRYLTDNPARRPEARDHAHALGLLSLDALEGLL